ncbi:6-pyruvoyl tetrahydrobiopterin synthase [Amphibalanus amphitrite]|uniref:6-pyruvoyltetrahydropterin synthase n=1 Tax=Amphibalanus amphitrite TaxID=1232801 RepID=A0A6A4VK75_AMPAM|nr:6-pyruvoyl tetrahydrobiopterin synthase [Amphibalanus amphitrite]
MAPDRRAVRGTGGVPIGYITRIQSFSACHRLHSVHLSDEENKKIFGKCNHVNGHGHNYRVEVTARGPIHPHTGMVVNISDMKVWIERAIMDVMDHRNIDKDVPYFRETVSTAENIAVFIWESLQPFLPSDVTLFEVKLFETDKNIAVFRGEYQ